MRVLHFPLQLHSVRQAAQFLNLSEHCVWRLIKERRLPVVRVRQRVMVSQNALERFIKKNTFRVVCDACSDSGIRFKN